jgi:hypothetical protein
MAGVVGANPQSPILTGQAAIRNRQSTIYNDDVRLDTTRTLALGFTFGIPP